MAIRLLSCYLLSDRHSTHDIPEQPRGSLHCKPHLIYGHLLSSSLEGVGEQLQAFVRYAAGKKQSLGVQAKNVSEKISSGVAEKCQRLPTFDVHREVTG
jgi:hypothetical protein